MNTPYFEDIIETFEIIENPTEKLEALIEFGKQLKDMPNELKIEKNKVLGCTSNVYIDAILKNNLIQFFGYSQALTTKGFVAILINGLSNRTKEDFLNNAQNQVEDFLKRSNIQETLVPSRANAIGNIFLLMKEKVKNLQ